MRELSRAFHGAPGRYLVVAPPLVYLSVFFLLPLLIVLKISFASPELAQPPYSPLLVSDESRIQLTLNLSNYVALFEDPLYATALVNSLYLAGVSTLVALLIGYPMAYAIARARPATRVGLLLAVVLPFWTSSLLRTYAWMGILKDHGPLNQLLLAVGLIAEPMQLLDSEFAMLLGIVYCYLPFMVLPLVANLVRLDPVLLDAASDLGARPLTAFWRITVPLSLPGIIAGSMLVFIPALGEFVIPDLLGGPDAITLGRVLWTEFFANSDWPLASALAITLLVLIVLPLVLFEWVQSRQWPARG